MLGPEQIREIRLREERRRFSRRSDTLGDLEGLPGVELAAPADSEDTFRSWLEVVSPRWNWSVDHLVYLQAQLRRVTEGGALRLMIFMPPRHGKSEQTTIRYPVWRLDQDRTTRVCVGCYNQSFAERFGRRSRRLAELRGLLGRDRRASKEWETPAGGVYRACGVGSPPMGEGFDLILIDDPVKSRAEAESEAYREATWEWYTDLYTRREPGAAIILIQTRWHEDDLAGRLLAAQDSGGDRWEVVNLPALAEEDDPLGRQPGEALWPERWPAEEIEKARAVLGSYAFAAVYQQRPRAREGGFFKRAWFQIVDAAPAQARRVRCWDLAATEGDGDYTAGVRMSKTPGGEFFVEDVVHHRWGPGERDKAIKLTADLDGAVVRVRIEQEGGSGGKSQVFALVRLLSGFPARGVPSTGDKLVRADPFAAQCEAGNVKLLRGPWNAKFLNELTGFPTGVHDDQVDAASGAFNELSTVRTYQGAARVGVERSAL